MDNEKDILSLFHPLIKKWFFSKFQGPTEIQTEAWPVISRGSHILLTAPTGSGKTLTAFLWAINRLVAGDWECGTTRVLYISPLRALNNDIRRNLLRPLEEIKQIFHKHGEDFPEINVMTRSGDTPQSERRKMIKHPPEILITTPESLNLMLTTKSAGHLFSGVKSVILDEIHALAASKRGTHLITAVERAGLSAGDFQRIAISATVNPLEKIAGFVGGYNRRETDSGPVYEPRKVEIRTGKGERQYQISVRFPEAERGAKQDDFFRSLTGELKGLIRENTGTLIFVNNRRYSEKITHLLNEGEEKQTAYSHHGSLSRELRNMVERRMKSGELPAIVATNSLELGIDIGSLDMVLLVQTPPSVSSALQRIGRAGHEVGGVSRAVLYPVHGKDLIEGAVMYRSVLDGNIEPLMPLENPLDILSQIILSMTLHDEWTPDDLFNFIRQSCPYRNLPRKQFDLVISMLAGKYAGSRIRELKPRISVDPVDRVIRPREGAAYLLYSSGGTIPDRGYYGLRVSETGDKIGELDEEFVWERKIGETFTLGAQTWKIVKIGNRDVEVVPGKQSIHTIPFWRAEQQDRDFHYASLIASFLEECDDSLEQPGGEHDLLEKFQGAFGMTKEAAVNLVDYLKQQRRITRTSLPHRHHIVIEHYFDPKNRSDSKQVIIHTLWGGRVNKPFGMLLASLWRVKYGYELKVFADNDAILFMLPHSFSENDILDPIFSREIEPENFGTHLKNNLENTGFFGANFRENAGRALLLPSRGFRHRNPLWLTRLRTKKLLQAVSKYNDFPILLETWRTCLQDQFDLDSLTAIIEELLAGNIKISETETKMPSPFCGNIIWRQTNLFMYQDDTPTAGGASTLDERLLNEAVFSAKSRPSIDKNLAEVFRKKLQRTAPGYAPETKEELAAWVEDRLAIPASEWEEMTEALAEAGISFEADSEWLEKRIIKRPAQKIPYLVMTRNTQETLIKAGLLSGNPSAASDHEASDAGADPGEVLAWWLKFYPPVPEHFPLRCFDVTPKKWEIILEFLVESGGIITGRITDGAAENEICDSENLSSLIRIGRAKRRQDIQPADSSVFPLLIARRHNLPGSGHKPEHLMEAFEGLFGYTAPAEVWENEIIPARMSDYFPEWLDRILMDTELVWYGKGKGKIGFCLRNEGDLYLSPKKEGKREILPGAGGKYDFFEIMDHVRKKELSVSSAETAGRLWNAVWQGEITADSFSPVRSGIENRFKVPEAGDKQETPVTPRQRTSKGSYRKWKKERPLNGNWYYLTPGKKEYDPIEAEERQQELAEQFLYRYGICFRELVLREGKPFMWHLLFPVLRRMELRGEITGGYFLKGIPGPHFITSRTAGILSENPDDGKIFWMNAYDPASPCGLGGNLFPWDLPSRIPSNHLVFKGTELKAVSKRNGREIDFFTEPGDPEIPQYLEFLRHRQGIVYTEKINGIPTRKSPFRDDLEKYGFRRDFKAYQLDPG
ncbi:MAG: DEAD/DEAH box helicase [Spirochaetia bacterium]